MMVPASLCCGATLDFGDEWWFVCELIREHDGPHLQGRTDEQAGYGIPPFRIEWQQVPATVGGAVVERKDAPAQPLRKGLSEG